MFHSLLGGIHGSERTGGVLVVASALARACGARLHVLCVIDPAYFLEEPAGGRPSTKDEIDYPAPAIEREGADDLVRRTVARLRAAGFTAEGTVVAGQPARCITEAASRLGSDVIILGHRHLSWFGRLTERSVCSEVLEAASCPVLVVPSSRDTDEVDGPGL